LEAITDINELIERIDQGLAVRQTDVAASSRMLDSFYFVPPAELVDLLSREEPGTTRYYDLQMDWLYQPIAGRSHDLDLEGSDFPEEGGGYVFPFNLGPADAGYWTMIYGYILSHIKLPKGSRVLEVGFGPGGLTEVLVRAGLAVTAIESRASNCQTLTSRLALFNGSATTIQGDINTVDLGDGFDAIIFFESFHHMSRPAELLLQLRSHLSDTGVFIFAAEPILPDGQPLVPFPWGFRMNGASLSALREVGWVEFGFQESFFRKIAADAGYVVERHNLDGYNHCDVWVGRPDDVLLSRSLRAENRTLRNQLTKASSG
jgi:SAM-dependent methyltransferase